MTIGNNMATLMTLVFIRNLIYPYFNPDVLDLGIKIPMWSGIKEDERPLHLWRACAVLRFRYSTRRSAGLAG